MSREINLYRGDVKITIEMGQTETMKDIDKFQIAVKGSMKVLGITEGNKHG